MRELDLFLPGKTLKKSHSKRSLCKQFFPRLQFLDMVGKTKYKCIFSSISLHVLVRLTIEESFVPCSTDFTSSIPVTCYMMSKILHQILVFAISIIEFLHNKDKPLAIVEPTDLKLKQEVLGTVIYIGNIFTDHRYI